jgi:hypothetical protein
MSGNSSLFFLDRYSLITLLICGDVEVSACRYLVNPWRIEVSSKTKISSKIN